MAAAHMTAAVPAEGVVGPGPPRSPGKPEPGQPAGRRAGSRV